MIFSLVTIFFGTLYKLAFSHSLIIHKPLANHINHNMSREVSLYLIKLIFISIFLIKFILIGVLIIKNTSEAASIVVVFKATQNTRTRVLSCQKHSSPLLVLNFITRSFSYFKHHIGNLD